jgi:hypothetical protein
MRIFLFPFVSVWFIAFSVLIGLPENSQADSIPSPNGKSICEGTWHPHDAIWQKYCGSATSNPSVGGAGGGYNAQQQAILGGAQIIAPVLKDLLFGKPATPEQQAAWEEQQRLKKIEDDKLAQNKLAAQQMKRLGMSLMRQKSYKTAATEFENALAKTPDDEEILSYLKEARRGIQGGAVANQNSSQLGAILGASGRNVVPPPDPAVSARGALNLGSDPNGVELHGATKKSVDQALLKMQLDRALKMDDHPNGDQVLSHSGNGKKGIAPSNPNVVLPKDEDMELLGSPENDKKGEWPGPKRPTNKPKLKNPSDSNVVLPKDEDVELLGSPDNDKKSKWPGPKRPASEPKLKNPLDEEEDGKAKRKLLQVLNE